jgi:hypothetical protein
MPTSYLATNLHLIAGKPQDTRMIIEYELA